MAPALVGLAVAAVAVIEAEESTAPPTLTRVSLPAVGATAREEALVVGDVTGGVVVDAAVPAVALVVAVHYRGWRLSQDYRPPTRFSGESRVGGRYSIQDPSSENTYSQASRKWPFS